MDISSLLGSRECTCGKVHKCDIKAVLIGSGVIKEMATLVENYSHILLVADQNTYDACGEAVKEQLGTKIETLQIFKGDSVLIPNEEAVAAVEAKLTEQTDLIMAIGAGSMTVSHANDSYFWVVSQFSDMDTKAAYKCQTGMTAVMGLTTIIVVFILSLIFAH